MGQQKRVKQSGDKGALVLPWTIYIYMSIIYNLRNG